MASTSDQFFYLDSPTQFEEWVDFDQFLDLPSAYGDEYSASASTNSVSPDMALPYDAEMLSTDLLDFGPSAFPDMLNYDASQESFFADLSPEMGMIDDHAVAMDDSTFYNYPQYDASFDFRQVVEAQAAADPRVASIKEKRREAAIALHLQRLCEATALDLDMSSDSNTSFSSPAWSEYVRGSNSPQSASASPKTPSAPAPAAGTGGVEMVLDLNMNTAANLPKKQKPRSQAQKENYIKARKYGACEKHKKQHKRCNCLEKAAARMGVNDVPLNVAYKERPQPSAHSSPVLPDSRVSSVSGHDRSVSPTIRPMTRVPTVEALKRAINSSPGHDTSTQSSGVLPSVRTTTKRTSGVPGHNPRFIVSAFPAPVEQGYKTAAVQSDRALNVKLNGSGVRGHDPQYNASGFLTPVKGVGQNVSRPNASVSQPPRATESRGLTQTNLRGVAAAVSSVKTADKAAGSVGQNVSRQPQSVPQSVKTTNRRAIGQSNLRWRLVGFSPTTDAGVASGVQESRNTRQTMSTTTTSKPSDPRTPNLDVRRPRHTLSAHRVDSNVSSNAPVSSQALPLTVPTTGRTSGTLGVLPTNNSQRSMAGFKKPMDILFTRTRVQVEVSSQGRRSDSAPSSCPTLQSGQSSLATRSISTQLGGLFSRTVSACAGIGLSSVSFASWSEQSIGQCISILGSQLMAARKSFQALQTSLI
ncbi:hypothetical protein PEBR_20994 [Penicillium brasilianum]|uniref:Uncharacterized protein n=1 Tax=Penicillium brasilianum TaxID=104259 RepID=A0A1S9RLV9_PENBI|nr:hypothetical protein PEBR_20994 [Penicillium brasilianum]